MSNTQILCEQNALFNSEDMWCCTLKVKCPHLRVKWVAGTGLLHSLGSICLWTEMSDGTFE
jgi:hypothetical protein